jgi:hypothetical protein
MDCDKEFSSSLEKSLSSKSTPAGRIFFDLKKKTFPVFYFMRKNIYFRCLDVVERFLVLFDVTGAEEVRSGTS